MVSSFSSAVVPHSSCIPIVCLLMWIAPTSSIVSCSYEQVAATATGPLERSLSFTLSNAAAFLWAKLDHPPMQAFVKVSWWHCSVRHIMPFQIPLCRTQTCCLRKLGRAWGLTVSYTSSVCLSPRALVIYRISIFGPA